MSATNPVVSGIPMVSVPFPDGGVKLVSYTPITNWQWTSVVQTYLSRFQYVQLMRGTNSIATKPLSEGAVLDTYGADLKARVDSDRVIQLSGISLFLCKLVDTPSPNGSDGPEQPVVNVSPLDAEVWCQELSGGQFHLLSKDQMIHVLTEGRTKEFPTATGKLFDDDGRRLLHGRLKLKDGRVLRAVQGDPEYTTSTCDVEAKGPDGQLIYPDGPFGTRIAQAGICLIGANDTFFGGSWGYGGPEVFGGSYCIQVDPGLRIVVAGFCAGASA